MPIIAAPGRINRGDSDDACPVSMPHAIPTRAAVRANNEGPHVGSPDVDPQERIDSLFAHLDTGAAHHAYLQATTMTWAGIVACQMGAAFAVGTSRASLRQIGVFSNPHLLRGVAFALVFAAAIMYPPPLQSIFHTAARGPGELIVLACFPVIVWGSDELWRWRARRLGRVTVRHAEPAAAGAS